MTRCEFPSRMAMALMAAVVLGACSRSRAPQDPGDRVLARIGGETVTARDFDHAMRRRGGDVPEVFTNMANRRVLLDEIARTETLADAARRGGYFDRPEVRQAAQRQAIQLFQEEVRSAVPAPTDAEVAAHYAAQREKYSLPPRVRLALIRMALPAASAPEKRAAVRRRAEQARAEALALTNTPHFGGVATVYSDDPLTRYLGGDAGWMAEADASARYSAQVQSALASLEKAAVSAVIESPDALYLVKLMDRAAAQSLPLDTVRENIRIALARERQQRALDEKLGAHPAKVWVDEKLLAALPVPPPPAGAETRRLPPSAPADK